MTEQEAAQAAYAATWKWWGPIERPWAPSPVKDSLGRPEQNLQWWFREFWRMFPRHAPKTIDDA